MQILGPKRLNRAIDRNLLDKNGAVDVFGSAPLDLRFALQKTLDPRITFTRASSGTYVGADGLVKTAATNEARFDHNPTTGESLGLLVEEARTNLMRSSEDFSFWTATGASVTVDVATAPDGTTTADLWTNTTTPGILHQVYTKDTVARTYTGSLWVKPLIGSGLTAFTVSIDDGSSTNRGRATFNLRTGVYSSAANDGTFTNTSGTITAYPGEWYRLTITTTTSTGTTTRLRPFFSTTGGTVNVWGAQMEEGSFPTSYIPTTTATVTRAADVASITGTNFSSWYNQTEGTVFVDSTQTTTASQRLLSASDNSISNRVQLSRAAASSGNIQMGVSVGGAAQVTSLILGSNLAAGTSNKVAAGYKAADFAGNVNGLAAVTQGTGTVPSAVTQLAIGSGEAIGSAPMTGTIKRLTYWPTRLANATLQSITAP